MKKRFKEGNNVSPKNKICTFIKFIPVLIILLPQTISLAQIPLNGFCRIKEIEIPRDQNSFLAIDYSGDGYRDFIVYNSLSRKYTALTYDTKSKLFKGNEKYMPFVPGNFHPLSLNESNGKSSAFVSRKSRLAGILNFNRDGSAFVKSKILFDSYPKNIDVGETENNPGQDLLLSGSVFDGLLVLLQSKKGLTADTVVAGKSFKFSTFIDLDYDSYIDIAAVDLLTNTLRFFYNDQAGGFIEQRSIELGDDINELKCVDYNSNGFNDLVFIKNGIITAMLGDSVSTFSQTVELDTKIHADKYAVFDFNGDGFNDIAFINNEDGTFGICFAESSANFYPPVIYFRRKGLVDITAFVDRGGRKLALLDSSGKIYIIDKITGSENEFSAAAGIQPSLIGSFDYLNDGSPDFFTVDGKENKINFYLSARSNLFDKYYSYNISNRYSKVEVDGLNPVIKTFYCYSPGDRVIEMLRVNFQNELMTKRILYTDGPIEDLKLTSDRLKDRQTIFALIKKHGKLSLQSFDFRDFRYLRSGLDSIADDVLSAAISFDIYKEIYFFQKDKAGTNLQKLTMRNQYEKPVTISVAHANNSDSPGFDIAGYAGKTPRENAVAGLISTKNKTEGNVFIGNKTKSFSIDKFSASRGLTAIYNRENMIELFLYDRLSGKIKLIEIKEDPLQITASDLFESKSVNSYIVSQIKSLKEFFIYLDSNNSQLNFKTVR